MTKQAASVSVSLKVSPLGAEKANHTLTPGNASSQVQTVLRTRDLKFMFGIEEEFFLGLCHFSLRGKTIPTIG